jgi:leader peptidase (prepilin peptidase)/N-methyltransferase
VEVLTGLLFALLASIVSHQNQVPLFSDLTYSLRYIYLLFTSCCLLLVFFIDLKYGIIPFKIVLASFLAAVLWYVSSGNPLLVNSFLAGIGMFFFFLLLFVGTKGRGLGFGDVVFVALMGFLLGFPKIVLGIYVSFLTGALVSLILVLVGRKRLSGGTIPFGPFLVFGTFLALFWGDWIIKQVMVYLLHL